MTSEGTQGEITPLAQWDRDYLCKVCRRRYNNNQNRLKRERAAALCSVAIVGATPARETQKGIVWYGAS